MAAVKRVLWISCTTERMLKSGISKFEATIRSCRAASGINNSSSRGSSSSQYKSCSSRNFNVNTDCSSSLLIKNAGSNNLQHSAWPHQAPTTEENIFKSPFPDIEIPDVCLSHYVINEMSKYGNAIALVSTMRTPTQSCPRVSFLGPPDPWTTLISNVERGSGTIRFRLL